MINSQIFTQVTIRKIIFALVLWQFLSVALMAVGTWPGSVALISTALLAVFILAAQPYHSVLLLILSIPFYVIVPNKYLANLPMWRVLFVLLFVAWFVRMLVNQRAYLKKMLAIRRWYEESLISGTNFWGVIWNTLKRIDSRFMAWDKLAALFVILTLFSLLIARFPVHGFKQVLFLVNIYLLYIVVVNVVTDQDRVKEIIRVTGISLAIMVGLGFVQYVATMFSVPYYFWQYWATLVSTLYYGQPLGEVLAYSNSWFSSTPAGQSLRMFGTMPDTHSFGILAMFFLAYVISFTRVPLRWQASLTEYIKAQRWQVLLALFLAVFAVMAAGTRGIYVGMMVPLLAALLAYYYNVVRPLLKMAIVSYLAVIVLVVLSPFITQGLNWVRTHDSDDNFLDRAESIYDLSESSNAGRLEIWKDSVVFAALHPFGVGYGNFIVSLIDNIPNDSTFESLSSEKNLRYNVPQKFVTAHSLYLHILVELGFAGLLAFLLFWWEYFESLGKYLGQFSDEYNHYTLLIVALALTFIWILAYGLFDVTILNDRVLMYLFVSLGISGLIFAKYKSFNRPQ